LIGILIVGAIVIAYLIIVSLLEKSLTARSIAAVLLIGVGIFLLIIQQLVGIAVIIVAALWIIINILTKRQQSKTD